LIARQKSGSYLDSVDDEACDSKGVVVGKDVCAH